jgi:hypothetical protein
MPRAVRIAVHHIIEARQPLPLVHTYFYTYVHTATGYTVYLHTICSMDCQLIHIKTRQIYIILLLGYSVPP